MQRPFLVCQLGVSESFDDKKYQVVVIAKRQPAAVVERGLPRVYRASVFQLPMGRDRSCPGIPRLVVRSFAISLFLPKQVTDVAPLLSANVDAGCIRLSGFSSRLAPLGT